MTAGKDGLILKRNQVPQRGRPTHDENDSNFDRLMYWSGDWVAGSYEVQQVVEHKGRGWVCNTATATEPGLLATDWTLIGQQTLEVWQATPILSMNVTVIQWTFIPLFIGQVPEIFSNAAGVFTFLTVNAALDISLTTHVSFEYAANNSEANYSIAPTFVGSGIHTLLSILDADSSTRSTLPGAGFGRTAYSAGSVLAASGDTLSYIGDSGGTNGSDVDLVNAFLQVAGPTP